MQRPKKPMRRDAGRPRGQAIEDALLARALEELVEHGLDGASVDRIARAAEVNKTSVYRRFKTREGLIAAALGRVAGDVSGKMTDQGSLRGDLGELAGHIVVLLSSPLGRGLGRAAFAEADSEIGALAAHEIEKPREAARAMVERARARGEWREGASPEVALAALVGALLHRALLEKRPLDPEFVGGVVDLVASGVLPAARR